MKPTETVMKCSGAQWPTAASLIAGDRGGAHLSLEDVAQVAAALCARDLGALHAEADVHMAVDSARDLIVECGPVSTPSTEYHNA